MSVDPAASAILNGLPQVPDLDQIRRAHGIYNALGYRTCEFDRGTKAPREPGWPTRTVTEPRLLNLGIILGEASGWLTDVDLDTPEAIAAAPWILPATKMKSRRHAAPVSHFWYRCQGLPPDKTRVEYNDPKPPNGGRACLVELRWGGRGGIQTAVPPSILPRSDGSGDDRVEWEDKKALTPAEVDPATLQQAVRKVAAVALLARRWVSGKRHAMVLPWAGTLARGGIGEDAAVLLTKALCAAAGDPEVDDRIQAVADTYQKHEAGISNFSGIPTLKSHLGSKETALLCEWLGIETGSARLPQPDLSVAERYVQVKDDLSIEVLENARLAEEDIQLPTMQDVINRCGKITWLWQDYLANGAITLIVADKGVGKSWVAQSIVACVVHGLPWPNSAFNEDLDGGYVLWVEAEGRKVLNANRLKGMNVNLDRVVMPEIDSAGIDLTKPQHWLKFVGAAQRPEIKLIVIDSLSGAHEGDENKTQDQQRVMKRLANFAEFLQKPIIVTHHLRKKAPGQQRKNVEIDDVRGSGSITQYAQVIVGITRTSDESPVMHVKQIRNNLVEHPREQLEARVVDGIVEWDTVESSDSDTSHQSQAYKFFLFTLEEAGDGGITAKKLVATMQLQGHSYQDYLTARAKAIVEDLLVEVDERDMHGTFLGKTLKLAKPIPAGENDSF